MALHRAVGSNTSQKNEPAILAEIKKYAVHEENTLISRNILRGMVQNHSEDIKHFAARVKGQADICNYTVKFTAPECNTDISYAESEIKDQICKGLADQDIQQEVMSQKDQNMSLDNLISFISSKESGKRSYSALSKETTLSKISPYQKNKNTISNQKSSQNVTKSFENFNDSKCIWCGNKGHGSKANLQTRMTKCPAYGKMCKSCDKQNQFSSVCPNKNHKPVHNAHTENNESEENENYINSIFISSIMDTEMTEDMEKIANISTEPLPHMEHDQMHGWTVRKPKEDPTLTLKISTCKDAYTSNKLPFPASKNISMLAVADTGARTTVAGMSMVQSLGLQQEDLFPVKQKLCGANNSPLNILGGLFLTLESDGLNKTNVLCYIQEQIPKSIYLSRSACESLGLIEKNFPNSYMEVKNIICDADNCNCPARSKPPSIPKQLPYPATEENRELLEKWILQHYKSSTFNVCEHQPLPLMSGPPLQIHVDPKAKPHAVHTPIPVPVHWQKAVKSDLDRDVRLGVIEEVPWGTPTTWCSRMVTVAKKDGKPRRTVDLQPLNAASVRQTHHTQSPFNQASAVPSNTKKTVCDAWNGYHSVQIREEDRDFTTFITPWGRYRYKTAPQGYLAAGDAYTRRYDEIISDVENKTKCVDDTILWANNLSDIFFSTCEFLAKCGNNGITLNPKKFQFGKDEVEFAGFEITSNSIKPCNKFLKAITEFPTPNDITGIRSWFGLINQVSYSFSITAELQPFRDLLKPRRSFYWDDNLQKLFDKSKNNIVEKVKHGVRLFDPEKYTCLTTDWSKVGTGFSLSQKHCKCISESIGCCRDGWKLVFAGSKFNNAAESRYAPIEGECLGVVRALFKTRYFILGCKHLCIATDHKPLLKILGDKQLEDIHNPRLFNLKEKTLRYCFKIVHIPGKMNNVADAVSRYPSNISSKPDATAEASAIDFNPDEYAYAIAINSLSTVDNLQTITWEKVEIETLSDVNMHMLLNLIQQGFPDVIDNVPQQLKTYFKFRNDLSTVGTVILYKNRIVMPPSLRNAVLLNLHSAHQGVSSMISRAETSVFWPGITNDVNNVRIKCGPCNNMCPSQPNPPPKTLNHPQYPFQMICADYFHFKGNNYLVIVDRYSN